MEKILFSHQLYVDNLDPDLIPDVVLQVGTEQLTAHRAVLACQSKFLRQMFLSPEHSRDQIVLQLPDFTVQDVKKLVDFMYGKLTVSQNSRDLMDALFLCQDDRFDSLNGHFDKNALFAELEQTDIETTEVLIDNNNYCRRVYDDGSENLFCGLCNLGFTSEAMLISHLKQHPVCHLCNIQFVRDIDLLQHVSTHPQCGVCGEQLLDQMELDSHEKSHTFSIPCSISVDIDVGNIDLVNDPLIEGKRYSELFQEVNPDLYIENVECTNSTSQDKSLNYLEQVHLVNNEAVQFSNLCNFCNKEFEREDELLHHTALVHKDYVDAVNPDHHQFPVNEETLPTTFQFMCSICHIQFDKIVSLTKHVTANHPVQQLESGKLFYCKFCPSASFLMINDLITHFNYYHSHEKDKSVTCPDCPDKTFKSLKMLKTHLNFHVGQKPFQCAICFKLFTWENGLRQHVPRCDGSGRSRGRRSKTSDPVSVPKKTSNTRKKKFQETIAIIKDLNFSNLNVSNDSTSTGKRRFTCQECGLVFKTRDMIRDHVRNCKEVLLKDTQRMQQLAFLMEEEDENETHRKFEETVNTDDYDYDFEDLEVPSHMESFKDFLNQRGRNNNNDTPHPRVQEKRKVKPRIHECEDCFKKFRTISHLKEHQMTHTGEFPYKCSDCGKNFRRNKKLLDHVCNLSVKTGQAGVTEDRSQEEEETFLDEFKRSIEQKAEEDGSLKASFDCSICGDGFGSLAKLDKHMEGHRAGQDTPITRQGSETTRSGRVIKPKRFFEDWIPETKTRRRRKTGTVHAEGRQTPVEVDRRKFVLLSTQCSYCELDLETHVELFRHVLGHLDPDIVKTFPVYEDGETGWCPNCSEPITLNFAEEHMMEKHSDIIIPRPEDMEEKDIPRLEHMEEKQGDLINPRLEPVSGPSFTTVSGAGDTPSHGIQDQERFLAKLTRSYVRLERMNFPLS